MKVITPEDIQSMLQGPPPLKDLRIEVRLYERTKAHPDAPWSPFREVRRVEMSEAAMKVEATITSKGESLNIHAAGMNDDPMSRPPKGLPS